MNIVYIYASNARVVKCGHSIILSFKSTDYCALKQGVSRRIISIPVMIDPIRTDYHVNYESSVYHKHVWIKISHNNNNNKI